MTFTPILALLLACAQSAPAPQAPVPPAVEPAGTLFFNGRIRLDAQRDSVSEALLERGGRVVAVGTDAELLARPDAARALRVDLRGLFAVPGLQDAHGHVESYGASLERLDLRGVGSYAELIERVKARAAEQPEGSWILGRGWDQNLWASAAFPHHLLLSQAVPRHPVLLRRVDGHAALANAAALTAAGLDGRHEQEPAVAGGRVFLGEDGRASGVLLDAAMGLVESRLPPATRAEIAARILAAQQRLLAVGLTAVHDMGIGPETIAVYQDLVQRGELKLRVAGYLAGNGEWRPETLRALPRTPDALDRFWIAGVKLLADGALGSRGAALLEDYADAPGERGLLLLSESELARRLTDVARAGLQPAVHAIGDRANRLVLDCYERLAASVPGFRELRARIEHAQVVAPRDWPRFPELGVTPSMQPLHAITDGPWVRARLGPERARGAYVWRSLAPELGALAFGSDFPVEDPSPLLGLHAARTREVAGLGVLLPEQRLEGAAALAGFTSGAARAVGQEDRRGRLLPGYFCDLTVLDVDPVVCESAQLLKAEVLMTVINGEIVYRAP